MNLLRSSLAALVIAIPLAADRVSAADCGDTAGAGGVDVPCNCGDTVTTSTRLGPADPVTSEGPDDVCLVSSATDPANEPGYALAVGAGVDLDLNGHQIRGQLNPPFPFLFTCGIGIVGDGVTVRDGSLSRFGFLGVCGLVGANAATISNVKVSDGSTGIFLLGGSGHLVQGNKVTVTRGIPPSPGGSGIQLNGVTQSTVSKNVIAGPRALGGISALGCDGCIVVTNSVHGNSILFGNGMSVEDNRTSGGAFGAPAFWVAGDSNTVRGNRSSGNGDIALQVTGNDNDVESNVAKASRVGIAVNTGSGNTLTNNKAIDNFLNGIVAQGGNIDGGGNSARKTEFRFQIPECTIAGAPCAI
jgi:parallel beta-helix repeat protein